MHRAFARERKRSHETGDDEAAAECNSLFEGEPGRNSPEAAGTGRQPAARKNASSPRAAVFRASRRAGPRRLAL